MAGERRARPRSHWWRVGQVAAVLAVLCLIAPYVPFCSCCVTGHMPWRAVREPSPDGRFEVVRETANGALDSYTRLWITERWGSWWDWQLIAPTVDGTWWADWIAPDHLLLTDYGEDHRGAALPPLQAFRGVRIETRGPAASRRVAASDGLHEAVLWEEQDSRGTRQFAWVQSTWNNEEKLFEEVLPAGLWSIEARWLANDRVEFAVQTATPDAPLPVAPTRVGGITVEVVRR